MLHMVFQSTESKFLPVVSTTLAWIVIHRLASSIAVCATTSPKRSKSSRYANRSRSLLVTILHTTIHQYDTTQYAIPYITSNSVFLYGYGKILCMCYAAPSDVTVYGILHPYLLYFTILLLHLSTGVLCK